MKTTKNNENNSTMVRALELANNVQFLDKSEVLQYASALYGAMMWGKRVSKKKRRNFLVR